MDSEFIKFCEDYGIQRDMVAPYTLQQNRVTERKNNTFDRDGQCNVDKL